MQTSTVSLMTNANNCHFCSDNLHSQTLRGAQFCDLNDTAGYSDKWLSSGCTSMSFFPLASIAEVIGMAVAGNFELTSVVTALIVFELMTANKEKLEGFVRHTWVYKDRARENLLVPFGRYCEGYLFPFLYTSGLNMSHHRSIYLII